MSKSHDDRAVEILTKAIEYAKEGLNKGVIFHPFGMIMDDNYNIEIIKNDIEDIEESYDSLGEEVNKYIAKGSVDILVLAVDTDIPDNLSKGVSSSIRLHIEEKSQRANDISARFLYVPYELCKVEGGEIFTKLHTPIAVGLIAEYIQK